VTRPIFALLILVATATGCLETEIHRSPDRSASESSVILEFSGSVDPQTGGLTLRVDRRGLASTGQALTWEAIPVVRDGVAGSGPPDTAELVTDDVTVEPAQCALWLETLHGVDRASAEATLNALGGLCARVTLRHFFADRGLSNVYAEITEHTGSISQHGYTSALLPGYGVAGRLTGGIDAPTPENGGLFPQGSLGPHDGSSRANEVTTVWAFRRGSSSPFTFRGRVVEGRQGDGGTLVVERVSDIEPGPGSSNPTSPTALADTLFFRASSTALGSELYRVVDGGHTELVSDLNPGPAGSAPSQLVAHGDWLYFSGISIDAQGRLTRHLQRVSEAGAPRPTALDDPDVLGVHGEHLVVEAGEASRRLYAIGADGSVSERAALDSVSAVGVLDDTLYARRHADTRLYRVATDGAIDVIPLTEADASTLPAGSNLGGFTPFAGSLYLSAAVDDAAGTRQGVELLRITGTHTIEIVGDLATGAAHANPASLFVHGEQLLFAANGSDRLGDPVGRELYRVNAGGSVSLVADINPGEGSSSPADFVAVGDDVYFTAESSWGRELWRLGADGALVVFDLIDADDGDGSSAPTELTAFAGQLYFAANGPTADRVGRELFSHDPLTLAWEVSVDSSAGRADGSPSFLTVHRDSLYFAGAQVSADGSALGRELMRLRSLTD